MLKLLVLGAVAVVAAKLDMEEPYVRCSVCEVMAIEAHKQAVAIGMKVAKQKSAGGTGETESLIESMVAKLCDNKKKEGKWIRKMDIVKENNMLVLDRKQLGVCNRECHTVEKACDGVLEEMQQGEVTQTIQDLLVDKLLQVAKEKAPTAEELSRALCRQPEGVCEKTPRWPKSKSREDEEHMTPEEARKMEEAHRLLDALEGIPMSQRQDKYRGGLGVKDDRLGVELDDDEYRRAKDEV